MMLNRRILKAFSVGLALACLGFSSPVVGEVLEAHTVAQSVLAAESEDVSKLIKYLGMSSSEFSAIETRYFARLKKLLVKSGSITSSTVVDRSTFRDAVRKFQRENSLTADGLPGEGTLWALQVEGAKQSNLKLKKIEGMDTWVRPGTGPYEPNKHGYSSLRLREDAAAQFIQLRDEVQNRGGLVTSSGSFRSPSAQVTSGRSEKSMHYSGLAFDLATPSGLVNPDIDPYVMTKNGRQWTVWVRVTEGGSTETLQAVVWKNGKVSTRETTGQFLNFTELASTYGFKSIGSRSCFPQKRLCAEWWHFQYEEALVPGISQFGIELLSLDRYSETKLKKASGLWKNRKKIFERGKGKGWY